MLLPKIFTTLRHYSRPQFFSDLSAGIVVGIVAIPLALAFAIASGVPPERGLYTAIVAGFLISALGGSRVLVGGPTGAFVVIVYGIVQKYGLDGLVSATLIAGVLLMLMGLLRAGTLIKFIPRTVIVGFTSGIAVIILSSQVKDFFGLDVGIVPADFVEKWKAYLEHFRSVNLYAFAVAAGTVLVISLWPRVSRRVPGSLVALVLAAAAVQIFGWPVETVGSRFGEFPRALPSAHWPSIHFGDVPDLLRPAVTIALLGAIESLLAAVVADGMIGGKHRSNMELVGQGAANVGSALFGGMPATGAIARTVTNIKNGGRTPVAGLVHAATVLLAMLFFGPWIQLVPLACLAGILTVVAYHMSEWRSFRDLLTGSRGGALIMTVTFALTVLVDLTVAIEAGVALTALLFLKRILTTKSVRRVTGLVDGEAGDADELRAVSVPKGIEIYEIDGPLFFGAANELEEVDRALGEKPRVRILRFKNVPYIDGTALSSLKNFHKRSKSRGIHLIVAGLHVQPLNELIKSNLYDLIGEDNVFSNLPDALTRAGELLRAS